MARSCLILLALAGTLLGLETPPGVVAIPSQDGPGLYGFACGGSAVVIAPGRALTLVEALPEAGPVMVQVGDRRFPASELSRGTKTGAVLLSFDAAASPAALVPADSARLNLGDVVWTVGNSYGILEQDGVPALSRGVISGRYHLLNDGAIVRGRGGRILSEYRGEVLETDAAVNDGNQGGALLDEAGNLVALVSMAQARERRLGTAIPIHLIYADLGLAVPSQQPVPGTGIERILADHAVDVSRSVALVYLERTEGLGNPDALPRPPPLSEDIPAYQRERLQNDWDRYYHQQQVFFTDQPVSAIVVDRDLVLTSASHLHGNVRRGRVLTDGGSVDCEVVAVHTPLDLVLLRCVEPLDLPVATLAENADLACGDALAVIGRHRSQSGYTLTTGVVSATERRRSQGEFILRQTDAMTNYGNLGGAVINRRGEVVGITVFLGPYDNRPWLINSGVAPFVDAASMRKALTTLREGTSTKEARIVGLGLQLAPDETGLRIVQVVPESGADQAGVLVADVITAIDGEVVRGMEDITRHLVRRRVGDKVVLRLNRAGEELRLTVELSVIGAE